MIPHRTPSLGHVVGSLLLWGAVAVAALAALRPEWGAPGLIAVAFLLALIGALVKRRHCPRCGGGG